MCKIKTLDSSFEKECLDLLKEHALDPSWKTIDFQRYRVYGALKDNKNLIGIAIVSIVLNELEILYCVTHKLYRKQGIANKLLDKIEKKSIVEKINTFHLEVSEKNTLAQKIYTSNGFHICGKRKKYYTLEDNSRCDAILMQKMVDITGIEPVTSTMST
jgi:ribosomal protein S18 acetylase RimI-like enzyme